MTQARVLVPAARQYRGKITTPERWSLYEPRVGDVVVATPAKSGTTWTQSIVAMLLNGGPDLPAPVSTLSPWVDSNLKPEEDVREDLARQKGRRVIKTHTAADGYPVWEGIKVVRVYRNPMEAFHSLRKHLANMYMVDDDHPMLASIEIALEHYLTTPYDPEVEGDFDVLATIVHHLEMAHLPDRAGALMLHYSNMSADHAGVVAQLDAFLETGCDAATQAAITAATAFGAMKARAADFAPEAGSGLWRREDDFFAAGKSGSGEKGLSAAQVDRFRARLQELMQNADQRRWLETGQ